MNSQIKEKYQIEFENQIIDWKELGGKRISKSVNTNKIYLTDFLNDWNAKNIVEFLLPEIEKVLQKKEPILETGSETIILDIEPVIATFYLENVGLDFPTVPTLDLKEILLDWKDFLLTPPLDGTKVK